MASGAIIARIVSQYTDKGAKAARKDIAKLGADFDKFAKRSAKAFGLAGAASAAFAVKIGKDAVQAAIADQKSQSLLANSLRNTIGATDAAIASVENYITSQQKLFSVADDKLRPSLAALAAATGSITTAQKLQNTALDIAADKQIDLQTASVLLAKGFNGNLTALKKLYPQISAATVKSKDFETALALVAKISGGQAAAAADTLAGRLEGLKLAYGEILETLGYALLPVLTEFVGYIQANLLPILDQWVAANKDKIASSLKNVLDGLINTGKQLGEFFGFITRNIETLKVFGAVLAGIFVGTKIYAGVTALIGVITLLTAAFTGQAAAASAAAIATGFATAGASLIAAGAVALIFYNAMDKVTKGINTTTAATESMDQALQKYKDGVITTGDTVAKLTKEQKAAAALAATNAKKAAKVAADAILTEKAKLALKKLGATVKGEDDPIALEAARLNLVKSGNLAEQARLATILKTLEAQLQSNEAIQRYTDLLQVVQDARISPEEVVILATKWGISREAVVAYTTAIFAVNDGKISSTEVVNLAKQWGVTKDQAATYLDFFSALNDGKLDETEIIKLAVKWNLTNKQVLDYAALISKGATPSDLWPVPGNTAKKSWEDALKALNDYIAKSGSAISQVKPADVPPSFDPYIGSKGGIGVTTISPTISEVPKVQATFEKVFADMNAMGSNQTQSAILALSSARYEALAAQYANYPRLAEGGLVNSPTLSMIGEAGPEAVIPLSKLGNMGGTTINLTVQGSVTSERDLATSIRNALLVDQSNGSSITYSSAL